MKGCTKKFRAWYITIKKEKHQKLYTGLNQFPYLINFYGNDQSDTWKSGTKTKLKKAAFSLQEHDSQYQYCAIEKKEVTQVAQNSAV